MYKGFLFLLFLVLILTSCGRRVVTGTGPVTAEKRGISDFTIIDISAPVTANIHVKPGAKTSLELKGYKNLLDEIDTEVEGNTLRIETENAFDLDTGQDIYVEITVGSLDELDIHGSADAKIDGPVTGGQFTLTISGAGDVILEDVHVSDLVATISGAGDVDITSGSAQHADFRISGAGNIHAFGLQAEDVTAKVSGAGDVNVTALKNLEAKVSGAGSIHYKGKPALKSQTSGIGEIAAE